MKDVVHSCELVIFNPENMHAQIFHFLIPERIIFLIVFMNRTVNLNDCLLFVTVEIRNKIIITDQITLIKYRMLSKELKSVKLPTPELLPEEFL